jgi:hypothetical protein
LLVPIAGGKAIPKDWEKYGIIAGIKAEEWNGFHDMILWDELMRGGAIASIFIGLVVGAPPIRHYGSEWLKNKWGSLAHISICLADAIAGSFLRY